MTFGCEQFMASLFHLVVLDIMTAARRERKERKKKKSTCIKELNVAQYAFHDSTQFNHKEPRFDPNNKKKSPIQSKEVETDGLVLLFEFDLKSRCR